jgi:hypothetical protein
VAPPGNQAATEKTNINLYHSENPVYSPKVGRQGFKISELEEILWWTFIRLEFLGRQSKT